MSAIATRKDPVALPMQFREAPVGEIDQAARTIDVVFTTGATVRRLRYNGWDTPVPFDEVLTVSPEAVNLERLIAGAPVLDSHSRWSTFSQVAVTESPRIENGQGLVRVRFPSKGTDELADRMFAMVDQRIIRNISAGYFVDKVRIVPPAKEGEVEKMIVERWTPFEISFVTVPADKDAQAMRAGEPTQPLTIIRAPIGPAAAAAARMRMLAALLRR